MATEIATTTSMTEVATRETKKDGTPESIILASSESRFLRHKIPSWISYWMALMAFPLNAMMGSWILFVYCICFSDNLYARTLCIGYMLWMVFFDLKRCDGIGYPNDREPFRTMRHWVRNNWFYGIHSAYYPIRLHKLADLPAEKKNGEACQYLFTCHPHGVLGVGTMQTFATDELGFKKLYPGIDTYMTGLRQVFYTPLFRDWCLLGGIMSSDKVSFRHIFEEKKASAALNLGGAAEAFIGLDRNPTTGKTVMKLLLKDRKGFCKLALQHGVSLVPVITFEEHLLFDLIRLPSSGGTWLYKLQLYLQKHVLGFAPLLVMGNKWPLMPKRHPLNVFVGKPIACPRIPQPTSDEINAKHKEYCEALKSMFQQCKKLVPGCEDWELELIEHPFKSIQKN